LRLESEDSLGCETGWGGEGGSQFSARQGGGSNADPFHVVHQSSVNEKQDRIFFLNHSIKGFAALFSTGDIFEPGGILGSVTFQSLVRGGVLSTLISTKKKNQCHKLRIFFPVDQPRGT
jgi:hypothetical protein